jgi:hypothetical protein
MSSELNRIKSARNDLAVIQVLPGTAVEIQSRTSLGITAVRRTISGLRAADVVVKHNRRWVLS